MMYMWGLKLIRDNYPKYVVTMDPNVALIHDSGIVACSARQFLLDHLRHNKHNFIHKYLWI